MKPSVNHNKDKTQISFAAAGQHGLIDFYGASFLTDQNYIEQALMSAAKKCGATIIGQNFHKFGGEGGVTGVLLLAESHISIHTWPENDYAAIDIFMCGDAQIESAIADLKTYFKPTHVSAQVIERGLSHEV